MPEIIPAKIYKLSGDEKDRFFSSTAMMFTVEPVGKIKEISTYIGQTKNKPEGILYHYMGEGDYTSLMIIPLPRSNLERFMEENFDPKKRK